MAKGETTRTLALGKQVERKRKMKKRKMKDSLSSEVNFPFLQTGNFEENLN